MRQRAEKACALSSLQALAAECEDVPGFARTALEGYVRHIAADDPTGVRQWELNATHAAKLLAVQAEIQPMMERITSERDELENRIAGLVKKHNLNRRSFAERVAQSNPRLGSYITQTIRRRSGVS